MNFIKKHNRDIKALLWLFGAFSLARILFIWLMPKTYSRDLYAWLQVIDVLKEGGNPYIKTGSLNWPPFWMQMLYGVHVISEHTSVSPVRLIQTILIGAESIVLLLSYVILKKFVYRNNPSGVLIASMVFSPVCILLNCQHCNFDVFVGLWVLLFTYALMDFYSGNSPVSWLMACFFLGMGILTKTVPLLLSPLLVTGLQKQKLGTILFGFILLFTPVLIGMSIIYSLSPADITIKVLNYRSLPGWYGITGVLSFLNRVDVIILYQAISPFIILSLILFLTWRCINKTVISPKLLITIILLLLISVPTFGPGYSPTYISWFLPLIVILFCISEAGMKKFLVAGYVIVGLTYITEYAFFRSHGAFMVKLVPSEKMMALSDMLGAQKEQVIIRLPMFVFYVSFFILLLRSLNSSPPQTVTQGSG